MVWSNTKSLYWLSAHITCDFQVIGLGHYNQIFLIVNSTVQTCLTFTDNASGLGDFYVTDLSASHKWFTPGMPGNIINPLSVFIQSQVFSFLHEIQANLRRSLIKAHTFPKSTAPPVPKPDKYPLEPALHKSALKGTNRTSPS